jgi:2-polyprenyl-6-methoxyphenol hydroxylase-like FAD-dependent oxidoreductase
LLDRLGLASDVLKAGHRIDTIVFYEGESRQAEINLSKLSVDFPFVVILPQSAMENLLEQSLGQKKDLSVDWSHRLASLQTQGDAAVASIAKLGQTAKGYSVADWEWVVEKTLQTTAAFIMGADGNKSHVPNVWTLIMNAWGSLIPSRFTSSSPARSLATRCASSWTTSQRTCYGRCRAANTGGAFS